MSQTQAKSNENPINPSIECALLSTSRPEEAVNGVIEIYSMYVDSMEKSVQRRDQAGRFFISINALFVAGLGVLLKDYEGNGVALPGVLLASIAGVLISVTWIRTLYYFTKFHKSKFDVIHLIERRSLPMAPFYAEWIALGQGEDPKKYVPFSRTQRAIPTVFLIIYLILALGSGILTTRQFLNTPPPAPEAALAGEAVPQPSPPAIGLAEPTPDSPHSRGRR